MKGQKGRKPMTIERDHQDWAERYAIYDQCYLEEQQILIALKGIDRARTKLIKAQNNLVMVVSHANDITRKTFGEFYKGGGVTAENWDDDFRASYQHAANKIARGQLRLVASQEQRQPVPSVRRRRAGPDDAA
jgi:hypothetical protein